MPVSTSDLYDPLWIYYCSKVFGADEEVKYYIFDGYTTIDGSQTWSQSDTSGGNYYIKEIFKEIDPLIDLDFYQTDIKNDADIIIYKISPYSMIDNNSSTIGITQIDGEKIDVLWKSQPLNYISNPFLVDPYGLLLFKEAYTINHEIGHALGLVHPRNDPWGSWHNSSDTVLSYNVSPYNHGYQGYPSFASPSSFSEADISALQYIWGVEDNIDSKVNHSGTYEFDSNKNGITADDIVRNWFGNNTKALEQQVDLKESYLHIKTSSWSDKIALNRIVKAVPSSWGLIQSKQVKVASDITADPKEGSALSGGSGVDIIRGLAGWDILSGGSGNDLIHGGNGRDVIQGGEGKDELHGDFGWNTYTSQKDNYSDLIAIKSDQILENWLYGKAGNSPNGEKADIIEELDSSDEIKIIGVMDSDLTYKNTTAHGLNGIGIYAKGFLEALYVGDNLQINEIKSITTGDGSLAAINNQRWSYRSSNKTPDLLT